MIAARRSKAAMLAAGAGAVQRLVQMAATLITIPIVLDGLGSSIFGIWGAITSLMWLVGLADLGLGTALVTPVARAAGLGRVDEAAAWIVSGLQAACGLAACAVLVAVLAVLAAAAPDQAASYLLAVSLLAMNIPLSLGTHIWVAIQKGHVAAAWETVQALVMAAGLVLCASLGAGLEAYVAAVFASLVLGNLGSLVHLLTTHPELRRDWASVDRTKLVRAFRAGLPYGLLTASGALAYWPDNILALDMLGPQASAQLAIALRICQTGVGLINIISLPLWPAFTDAAARSDVAWIRRALWLGMLGLSGCSLAGGLLLLAVGDTVIAWWLRGGLAIEPALLYATVAWLTVQSFARVPGLLLNAFGILRFQVWVAAAFSVLVLLLKPLLMHVLGVSGALWATFGVYLALVVPAYLLRIGLRPPWSAVQ